MTDRRSSESFISVTTTTHTPIATARRASESVTTVTAVTHQPLPEAFLTRNPKILIADDSKICLKGNKAAALRLGFLSENIVTCKDLNEAQAAFFQAKEDNQPFNIIWSDRDMGNTTDGDEFAKMVQASGSTPIFVMISSSLPETPPPGVTLAFAKDKSLNENLRTYFETLANTPA